SYSEPIVPTTTTFNSYRLDMGLWMKIYGFQFGFSFEQIEDIKKKSCDFAFTLPGTFNAIVSHEKKIISKHTLKNSIIIFKPPHHSKLDYSISSQIAFHNKFLVGVSYNAYNNERPLVFLSPNIGYNWTDKFSFILSFDLAENNATPYTNNSVELLLNYNF
ncbi:MAG: type IX secretion system membrane protein PorP/SprF, partial [Bacteroidota bacterium]|nr:type IX secretion system membrane protein PorP/SprF [Bacteroidota bacterium]